MSLIDRLIARLASRPPDFVIGGEADPYLRRWWVIPRNRWFNIYLHQFVRSDDDRALHDHPWANCSILLRGQYIEHCPAPIIRRAGAVVLRRPTAAHRVELLNGVEGRPRPVWTLFITGPRVREWGFWCPQGWRPWREFTAGKSGEFIGKGCDP